MPAGLSGRYVGRVGALAVALGVGGILAPAIASADDTPDRPSPSAHAADRGVPARVSADRNTPKRTPVAAGTRSARAAAGRLARADAVRATIDPLRARPVRRADPTAPAALPMAWAAAAVTRREFSGAARVAAPAAVAASAAAVDAPVDPAVSRDAPGAVAAAISFPFPPLGFDPFVTLGNLAFGAFFDAVQLLTGVSPADIKYWLWQNVAQPPITATVKVFVRQFFPEWAPLVDHVAPIVVTGIGDWLFYGTVSPEIDQLASDPVVLQKLSDVIAGAVTGTGVPAEAGIAVGNAAATWVNLALSGEQGRPVRAGFDTLLSNLPGLPGGWDTARFLWEFTFNGYTFEQLIEDQVGTPLQIGIGTFLSDAAVQQGLSNATAGALSVLVGTEPPPWGSSPTRSTGVSDLVGDQVANLIAEALLGDSPEAADVRQNVSDILVRLLGDPSVGGAAARAAGAGISALLGQAEIRDAIAITATNALRAKLHMQKVAVPGLQDAIGAATTTSVGTLLADTRVIAATGRTFGDLFAGLMSSAAVRELVGGALAGPFPGPIGRKIGQGVVDLLATPGFRDGIAAALGNIPMNLLGPEEVRSAVAVAFGQIARDVTAGVPLGDAAGPALTSLLENPAVRGALGSTVSLLAIDVINNLAAFTDVAVAEPTSRALATYAGTAVTSFLNYPGISTVLADTVDVVVTDAINGSLPGGALHDLQTNSTYRDALEATIPNLVSSVFGDSALRQSIAQLASVGAVQLMRGAGVDIPILNAAVGQATSAAVTSLLTDKQVARLVSTLAIEALTATPSGVLVDTALHAVLTEFGLQAAIGFALGRGLGALFGDNVFAKAFGEVTGAAATLVIATVAGITRLLVGDFAPPAAASIDTGRFFITLPVAANA